MNISNSYCKIEGNTDIGCVRKANEDWLANFNSKNGLVAVVCDGMGGHVGGAVASHIAVETIQRFLTTVFFENPRDAIVQACDKANKAVLAKTEEKPELKGMGSTCVLLMVRDGQVFVGSVGDSRIYMIKNKQLKQITKDQSFVQMLVDMGEITPEEAEHHPRKNEITNAIGIAQMRPATVLQYDINPDKGDKFILCSDGLSGMVGNDVIQQVAADESLPLNERVDKLIQLAKDNGGRDNVTCQIVEFTAQPPRKPRQQPVANPSPASPVAENSTQTKPISAKNGKKLKKLLLYIVPMVVAIILVIVFVFGFKACEGQDETEKPNPKDKTEIKDQDPKNKVNEDRKEDQNTSKKDESVMDESVMDEDDNEEIDDFEDDVLPDQSDQGEPVPIPNPRGMFHRNGKKKTNEQDKDNKKQSDDGVFSNMDLNFGTNNDHSNDKTDEKDNKKNNRKRKFFR